MAQEIINIGAAANDGTGDPLRTAFDKVNNNFTQLYNTLAASGPDGAIQFKNTNTLYSTLYVGGTYLIAGAPGRIYYSNDGAVWSPANTGTEVGLYSLAYDGIDTIIAVGATGTPNAVFDNLAALYAVNPQPEYARTLIVSPAIDALFDANVNTITLE
jgi:hypothetical protein